MGVGNLKKEREFIAIGFGVLTVSDSRDLASDKSGSLLEKNAYSKVPNKRGVWITV